MGKSPHAGRGRASSLHGIMTVDEVVLFCHAQDTFFGHEANREEAIVNPDMSTEQEEKSEAHVIAGWFFLTGNDTGTVSRPLMPRAIWRMNDFFSVQVLLEDHAAMQYHLLVTCEHCKPLGRHTMRMELSGQPYSKWQLRKFDQFYFGFFPTDPCARQKTTERKTMKL